MSEVAISVKGLSKRFRIGAREKVHDTFVQTFLHTLKAPFRNYRRLKQLTRFDQEDETVFWALRDVGFDVKKGEVLGIIGNNGAGKSTLLKILSRISEPTEGEVQIFGRVSALLEVGTGFHPDLTGRENVYMNGTILGMTKKEIDSKFDEIIEFSGIEKYIDTPVKFYSSGMKIRLGFAVAAHLEPEILIVDEVLAVGDVGFQRKCIGKMNEVAGSGRTVLFVSHNMAAVENLCTSGLLLNNGYVSYLGEIKETIKRYLDEFKSKNDGNFLSDNAPRAGSGKVRFRSFFISDPEGRALNSVQSGSTFHINIGYDCTDPAACRNVDVGFSIHNADDDSLLFIIYSSYTNTLYQTLVHTGTFRCRIDNLPLPEGQYLVRGMILENGTNSDSLVNGIGYLEVLDGDFFGSGMKSNRLTKDHPRFLVRGDWK